MTQLTEHSLQVLYHLHTLTNDKGLKDRLQLVSSGDHSETDFVHLRFHPFVMRFLAHLDQAWRQTPHAALPIVFTVTGARQYSEHETLTPAHRIAIMTQNFVDMHAQPDDPPEDHPYYDLTTFDPDRLCRWHADLSARREAAAPANPVEEAAQRFATRPCYLQTHALRALTYVEQRLAGIDQPALQPIKEAILNTKTDAGKANLIIEEREYLTEQLAALVAGRPLVPQGLHDLTIARASLIGLATRLYDIAQGQTDNPYIHEMFRDIRRLLIELTRGWDRLKDTPAAHFELLNTNDTEDYMVQVFQFVVQSHCSIMYITACGSTGGLKLHEKKNLGIKALMMVAKAIPAVGALMHFANFCNFLISNVPKVMHFFAHTFEHCEKGAELFENVAEIIPMGCYIKHALTQEKSETQLKRYANGFSLVTDFADKIDVLTRQIGICYKHVLMELSIEDVMLLANSTARHIQEFFYRKHFRQTFDPEPSKFLEQIWPWIVRVPINPSPTKVKLLGPEKPKLTRCSSGESIDTFTFFTRPHWCCTGTGGVRVLFNIQHEADEKKGYPRCPNKRREDLEKRTDVSWCYRLMRACEVKQVAASLRFRFGLDSENPGYIFIINYPDTRKLAGEGPYLQARFVDSLTVIEEDAKSREERLQAVEVAQAAMAAKLAEHQRRIEQLERERANLQKQLKAVTAELAELRTQFEAEKLQSSTKISALKGRVSALEKERARLSDEKSKLDSKLGKASASGKSTAAAGGTHQAASCSMGHDQGEEEGVGGFYDSPLLHEQSHDADGAATAQSHNEGTQDDHLNPSRS